MGIWISICKGWNFNWDHPSDQHDNRYWHLWTCFSKSLPHSCETLPVGKGWNTKVACSKSNLYLLIQLVSPNHGSTQRWWRKTFSNRLQNSKQGNQKVHMAHAKSRGHFFLNWVEPHISQNWILGQVTTTYLWINLQYQKQLFSPFGKFEYVKVPFGLGQAPAYFQELMTGILKDFNFAIAYLDDIIIFGKTPQDHLLHIRMVFEKLKSAKLSIKKSKCSFFSKETQYLRDIFSATGIRPLPAKTHAIQHMQPPTTPKQVRAFLGLVGYYRKFINGFARIAKPLTLLSRQQVKFEWTPVHHTTYLHLKEAIV